MNKNSVGKDSSSIKSNDSSLAATPVKRPKAVKASCVKAITLADFGITDKASPSSKDGFALQIRVLCCNGKQRTAACKSRSEVARTGKKPWRQKGTGRARAGTSRSPLWRGGGVIFGPQPGARKLKLTKKTKSVALRDLFFDYVDNKNISVLKWSLKGDKPSTSQAYTFLKDENLLGVNVGVFFGVDDLTSQLSFVNIPTVQPMFFDQPSSYELSRVGKWLIFEKDLDAFKEMVKRWI